MKLLPCVLTTQLVRTIACRRHPVRTASSEQVRRPIYREATEEWRPYEAYLDTLKHALGAVLDAYPQAPATFQQR